MGYVFMESMVHTSSVEVQLAFFISPAPPLVYIKTKAQWTIKKVRQSTRSVVILSCLLFLSEFSPDTSHKTSEFSRDISKFFLRHLPPMTLIHAFSFVAALHQLQKSGSLELNRVHLGESHLLELLRIRRGHLGTSNTLSRGIKVVESVLHRQRKNLSTNTESRVTHLDGHETVGLLDGLDDRLEVERLDGAQVEHLHLDAVLLLEALGRDQALADTARGGDNGQVLADALDLGLTERNDKVVLLRGLAHGEGLAVHELVLEDDDGVGVADGGFEQTLGVLGGPRGDDLQTGDGTVPAAEILGVLGGDTGSETVGAAEGDVAGLDTTGHVEGLGTGVDNLIDSLHGKVEGHELALDILLYSISH